MPDLQILVRSTDKNRILVTGRRAIALNQKQTNAILALHLALCFRAESV